MFSSSIAAGMIQCSTTNESGPNTPTTSLPAKPLSLPPPCNLEIDILELDQMHPRSLALSPPTLQTASPPSLAPPHLLPFYVIHLRFILTLIPFT